MPIHIDIRINDKYINTVHIGRDEELKGTDEVHIYTVTDRVASNTRPDWFGDMAVQFEHKYSDGLEICVTKGLQALYGKEN